MRKIMYHIHKMGIHDDDWTIGNVIDNRENFMNHFYDEVLRHVPAEIMNDEKTTFDNIVGSYLTNLERGIFVDLQTLKRLLYHSKTHIYGLNLFKREYILEEIRKQYYPDRISRANCIWLCTERGLKYWQKELGKSNDKKIFKVMIDGKLFPSMDNRLPKLDVSADEQIVQAHQYWNPGKLNGKRDIEYLFKGKLTILEEIKLPNLIEKENKEQYFNKLVRDRIPEKIEKNNELAVTKILSEKEYIKALKNKLFEEMIEVTSSENREEVLKECADMLEVIESITTLAGYTKEDLEQEKLRKREQAGGFEKRIFLTKTMKK